MAQSGGIGLIGMLAILFIALKLMEVIDWSWWYVLMPIYIPAGIGILALIGLGVIQRIGYMSIRRKIAKRGE